MPEVNVLRLIEIFASVQGESSLIGLPTTFVRLASCNLRCTWCDTPYSFGKGEPRSLEDILNKVETLGLQAVCVTGGEPLLQEKVLDLMHTLCDLGYLVSLETGGSLPIHKVDKRVKIILDLKCPGSGMVKKNLWDNIKELKREDEVKFVIKDKTDYIWAKERCEEFYLFDRCDTILFSPVHGLLDPKELVYWILEDKLPVRLNLQIHKYIWTPETKGV